jgi:acyl-coenzyme A synthetase/AMP-(fatty) acid ligase
VKGLRIGRRRGREGDVVLSPLELALRPALVDGRWQVPDRFNFTRDVVEALARDPKRRALTCLGREGVIEHRAFLEISHGASVWAATLGEAGVTAGDRVIVLAGSTVDWLEIVLGVIKVGAVVVPCLPDVSASTLERLVSSTDAALVVAERALEPTFERMGFTPDVHYYEAGVRHSSKDVPVVATHDTASRDLALIVSTNGVGGARKEVAHTHGSIFATRVQAEHWLDVGRGDAVWCTADAASPLTMWNTVAGPWSRGAEVVLHEGEFDADERLDLMFRLGPSILCQPPAEYQALAEHPKLERFRSPRLRRLVSTGDFLDPEVVAVIEERWGMTIYDGYGQAETNIVVANLADGASQPGAIGRAVPGHHVAIIDDQGNELPAGIEGDLAIRGRPPTLFAGYWELPEETKSAFLGDWYLTGDVAHMDEEGFFTFVGRAEDVITSNGRTFGPFDVERVLAGHQAIAAAAAVGIRDLQRGGQFVRAFVVPEPGGEGSEQLEAELRQYVAQTLPGQQVPREIVFVDALPVSGWKVSRHALRERPLAGRPLWEMPPTSELEMDASTPLPAPIDSEFSPRVDRGIDAPQPVALVPEPEPAPTEPTVIPEPTVTPELPVAPEPVIRPPEPALRAPEPVAEALPEPEPEPMVEAQPAPEPEPMVEAQPAPEPEPMVEVEPEPGPEPVREPVREPEPAPVTEVPAAVEPVFLPVPEAPLEPELRTAPLPEPEVVPEAYAAPDLDAEVDRAPEPVAEAFSLAESVEDQVDEELELADTGPEFVVAEALAEPEETPEPDPGLEPESEPEPEPPALIVLPEPAPSPEPTPEPEHVPEFIVASEPAPMPDYVIDAPDGPPPVVQPEPEPEPELGPLPDFVVEPGSAPEPQPMPVESALEADEEEDLGPLPDFVIDPDLPPELRPAPPPKPVPVPPAPVPPLKVPTSEKPEPTMSNAAGLYFPPTTAFPILSDDDSPRESKPKPRRRPPAEGGKSRHSTQPAEPGDEAGEVSWMAGLSNRLSAYSLSDDETPPPGEPAEQEPPDESAEEQ